MIDDERGLAERARHGDERAFAELVGRCAPSAQRVATIVLGTLDGADDVVQDATIRSWRAITGLDPQRGFRSWYLRAVANTARNDRRSRGRRARLALRAVPDTNPADPEATVVTSEERRVVLHALNRLDAADRLIIALRYFEDLPVSEVAHVLDCPEGTVKSRLSRAMTRLRAELPARENV